MPAPGDIPPSPGVWVHEVRTHGEEIHRHPVLPHQSPEVPLLRLMHRYLVSKETGMLAQGVQHCQSIPELRLCNPRNCRYT